LLASVSPSQGCDLNSCDIIQCNTTRDAEIPTLHISFFLKKSEEFSPFHQNRQLNAIPLCLLFQFKSQAISGVESLVIFFFLRDFGTVIDAPLQHASGLDTSQYLVRGISYEYLHTIQEGTSI
jgi:hypothetical protein